MKGYRGFCADAEAGRFERDHGRRPDWTDERRFWAQYPDGRYILITAPDERWARAIAASGGIIGVEGHPTITEAANEVP